TTRSPDDLPNRYATILHASGGVSRLIVDPEVRGGERTLHWRTVEAFQADPDGREQRPKPKGNRPIIPMSLLQDILGGEVQGEWLRCPSPSHGTEDRSMAVKPSRRSKYGFVVHPHSARDSVEECRAYILNLLEGEED